MTSVGQISASGSKPLLGLKCRASRGPSNRLKSLVFTICTHLVESLHAQDILRETAEVISNHHNQICQHEDAALEVVALPFSVHVAEQKHAQNNSHHIPLRKQQ